jgi:predicted acetyltransferase
MTAFARLMSNEAAMRAWNEFIEKDEDEQNKYLEKLDKQLAGQFEPSMSAIDDPNEKRSYHPGYSAKSCFQRMDKEFKKALSKKSGVRMVNIRICDIFI